MVSCAKPVLSCEDLGFRVRRRIWGRGFVLRCLYTLKAGESSLSPAQRPDDNAVLALSAGWLDHPGQYDNTELLNITAASILCMAAKYRPDVLF
jgi:hypothetical protein